MGAPSVIVIVDLGFIFSFSLLASKEWRVSGRGYCLHPLGEPTHHFLVRNQLLFWNSSCCELSDFMVEFFSLQYIKFNFTLVMG